MKETTKPNTNGSNSDCFTDFNRPSLDFTRGFLHLKIVGAKSLFRRETLDNDIQELSRLRIALSQRSLFQIVRNRIVSS